MHDNPPDWDTQPESAPQSGGPVSSHSMGQGLFPPNTYELAECGQSEGGRGLFWLSDYISSLYYTQM